MTINEIKLLLCCLVMCIATGFAVYKLTPNPQHKVAVVDAVKLFDEYNMKKEMEEAAKMKLRAESKQLDSMANVLQVAGAGGKTGEDFKRFSYDYGVMKKKLQDDYTESDHDINLQVWKRLNPLLDEYGKKNGYHLILGANGMGSVLYVDDYFDITADVVRYINKRYAEGN